MARKIKTDDELLAMMPKAKDKEAGEELNLGIMDGAATPTLAETLYAGRIVSGDAPMPDDDSPSFTPGTQQALSTMQTATPANSIEVEKVLPANDAEGRDLVNQLLGQAQAFSAAAKLLRTFGVSKLAFVKENKLYRQIEGMKLRTGSESLNGTWEEFCGKRCCWAGRLSQTCARSSSLAARCWNTPTATSTGATDTTLKP